MLREVDSGDAILPTTVDDKPLSAIGPKLAQIPEPAVPNRQLITLCFILTNRRHSRYRGCSARALATNEARADGQRG